MSARTKLAEARVTLIMTAALLTAFGLLAIYSASNVTAYHRFGDPFFFVKKQAFIAIAGFAAIALVARLPLRWLSRSALPGLLVSLCLLLATIWAPLSHRVNGASRWLAFGGLSFQPAEFAKLALLVYLAKLLGRRTEGLGFRGWTLWLCLGGLGLLVLPMLAQPDFGSAFLLSILCLVMLFTAGLPAKYLLYTSLIALPGIAFLIFTEPYRMARLLSFANPWAEIRGGGFQIIQSYVGFQNGGLWGVGLGESKQKLFFLPEAHTDFILSVIGEELGLFAVIAVIVALGLIVAAGIRIALAQTDPFRTHLAFGVSTLIAVQALLNLGVVMGMLPTKGIPLPFVSHGSSCLWVCLSGTAILARLAQPSQSEDPHGDSS